MNRVAKKILIKLYKLNNRVILFKKGKYVFVTEGLFTGLGAFFSILAFILYQASFITNPLHWFIEVLFILGFGMIGSRGLSAFASYCFTVRDPKKIRYPGFMYYGGMLGGIIGSLVFAIVFGYPILAVMDGAAMAAALAEAIGKIGCFTYGCCWGKPTKRWWGVYFKNPLSKVNRFKYEPGKKLIPTQLIQAAQLFTIFAILMIFTNYQTIYGQVVALYFILHAVFRLWIEKYRADTTKIKGNITLTSLISLTILTIGTIFLLTLRTPIGVPVVLQWWIFTSPWTYLIAGIGFLMAGVPMSIHYKEVGQW